MLVQSVFSSFNHLHFRWDVFSQHLLHLCWGQSIVAPAGEKKISKIKWKQIHFLKWSKRWIKLIGKSLSAEIRIHIVLRSCYKVDWRGFKRLEAVCCTKAVSLSLSQAVGSWRYNCLLLSSLPCPLPCNVLCYPASRQLIQLFKGKVTGGIKIAANNKAAFRKHT